MIVKSKQNRFAGVPRKYDLTDSWRAVVNRVEVGRTHISHRHNVINRSSVPWNLFHNLKLLKLTKKMPITVAERSEAWTVFSRSNSGIVVSNPTQGMSRYLRLFCVCVVLCVGIGLAMGWSLDQGVRYWLCKKLLGNWRRCQGPTKGCRTIDEWMND
jgi:hypothetical protein